MEIKNNKLFELKILNISVVVLIFCISQMTKNESMNYFTKNIITFEEFSITINIFKTIQQARIMKEKK